MFGIACLAVIGIIGILFAVPAIVGEPSQGPSGRDSVPNSIRPADQPVDPEIERQRAESAREIERQSAESVREVERKRAEEELEAIRAATVEASDLWMHYDANEVRADLSYKNRRLYVRGIVREIGKDFMDTPFIVLIGPDEFSGVQFAFSKGDEAELANIRKGQMLTVSGKCSGRVMMDVFVKDSKIFAR